MDGESDGVRTRDRPVKSRVLYLTKLQTQPCDLTSLFNRNGSTGDSSQSAARIDQCDDAASGGHHDCVTDADEETDFDDSGYL